jgi:hypothetical protein
MRTLLFPDETIRHKATSLAGNIVFHFSAKTQIIKQTIVTKLTLRSPLRIPNGRGRAAKLSIDPLLSVALVQQRMEQLSYGQELGPGR